MKEFIEYDAFISYSHRDIKWAKWLQKKLETWRIPSDILNTRERKSDFLKIFRDQTDLAGVQLQQSIKNGLDESQFLIVICSPRSAASIWVGAQIAYFKKLGREKNIIPFIVDGEPETDKTEIECYSPQLRNVPNYHYLGSNIKEIGKQKAFLRVMAALLNVRFDRLADRERRRKILRRSIAGGVAAVLLTFNGVLIARNQNNEIELKKMMYEYVKVGILQGETITPGMIQLLKTSGNAGRGQSCQLLGTCYRYGIGVDQDEREAFRWYKKAVELNAPDALVLLGYCYADGIGVTKNEAEAFSLYKEAADQGNVDGIYCQAVCYQDGTGVEADAAKAFELFQVAAEMGSPDARQALANCYRDGIGTEVDPVRAFEETKNLADCGYARSEYELAEMYRSGFGTETNPEQAFYWYHQAADQGYPDAQYRLGWCIENRYGISNPALYWYQKAMWANSDAAEAVKRLTGQQ